MTAGVAESVLPSGVLDSFIIGDFRHLVMVGRKCGKFTAMRLHMQLHPESYVLVHTDADRERAARLSGVGLDRVITFEMAREMEREANDE